jgi:hypothetical protein
LSIALLQRFGSDENRLSGDSLTELELPVLFLAGILTAFTAACRVNFWKGLRFSPIVPADCWICISVTVSGGPPAAVIATLERVIVDVHLCLAMTYDRCLPQRRPATARGSVRLAGRATASQAIGTCLAGQINGHTRSLCAIFSAKIACAERLIL